MKTETLKTERLTLSALREEDIPAYNALVLDGERNRWWGYDYRQDLFEELTEDYFLNVTKRDFKAKLAVKFNKLSNSCLLLPMLILNSAS